MRTRVLDLNGARALVGRKLFGGDWIGELSPADIKQLDGPFGPKRKAVRGTQRAIAVVARCPAARVPALERAWGKSERMVAQIRTADDWLDNHGFSLNPLKPRFDQDALARALHSVAVPKELRRPGAPATKREAIKAAMRAAIDSGEMTISDLIGMKQKVLAHRFGCQSRTTANEARKAYLKNARHLGRQFGRLRNQ